MNDFKDFYNLQGEFGDLAYSYALKVVEKFKQNNYPESLTYDIPEQTCLESFTWEFNLSEFDDSYNLHVGSVQPYGTELIYLPYFEKEMLERENITKTQLLDQLIALGTCLIFDNSNEY